MTSITRAERPASILFATGALLLFAAGAIAPAAEWRAMSAMAGMPTAGGGSVAMLWMPMHGESWISVGGAFVQMWSAMMIPMMLPAAAPALWEYRARVACGAAPQRPERAARNEASWLAATLGYAIVWCALGATLFPLGAIVVSVVRGSSMLASASPSLVALVIVAGGAVQFTAWKDRRLARCRHWGAQRAAPPAPQAAFADGARLARDCCSSCANWMLILLVVGMMDVTAMLSVTVAITLERVPGCTAWARRLTGGTAIAVGIVLLARIGIGG